MPLLTIENNDSSHREKLINAVISLSNEANESNADPLLVHQQAMGVLDSLAKAELTIHNTVQNSCFYGSKKDIDDEQA